jgi:SAM-dependent methyltransferase/uncharacterized protein YbaR (Trm112 family)
MSIEIDPCLLESLVCPRDHTPLRPDGHSLVCGEGHDYPTVNGVPVLLLDDVPQTMALVRTSLQQARSGEGAPYFVETVGLTAQERQGILTLAEDCPPVDPVVSYLIGATNGYSYADLIGKLQEYPIPHLRLEEGKGKRLLDIGCNWGRWCIAAARKGYRVVGIDPSLGAVMAGRRVAKQLGLDISYVVGDARFLPFRSNSFDTFFSYSVLQHFGREDCATAVEEIRRVLTPEGISFVQMPTALGVRSLYHLVRRGFREGRNFEVRYRTLSGLRQLFGKVGPSEASIHCFFGTGLEDSPLLAWRKRLLVKASDALRWLGQWLPLVYVADSVYVRSTKSLRMTGPRTTPGSDDRQGKPKGAAVETIPNSEPIGWQNLRR